MTSLVVSTIAYIVAALFIKRWLDGMDIPKTITRSLVKFVGAAVGSGESGHGKPEGFHPPVPGRPDDRPPGEHQNQ